MSDADRDGTLVTGKAEEMQMDPKRCVTAACSYEEPHDHGFACGPDCPCGEGMQVVSDVVTPEAVERAWNVLNSYGMASTLKTRGARERDIVREALVAATPALLAEVERLRADRDAWSVERSERISALMGARARAVLAEERAERAEAERDELASIAQVNAINMADWMGMKARAKDAETAIAAVQKLAEPAAESFLSSPDAISLANHILGVVRPGTVLCECQSGRIRDMCHPAATGQETAQESKTISPLRERDAACVARWPECFSMGYDPRCCRFPKSCSAEIVPPLAATGQENGNG